MKKLYLLIVLISSMAFSQTAEKKVWDLLLANKRTEARNLFNKELKSKVESNVDYLILDAMIDYELGVLSFDDTFVKKFVAICKQKEYLYPIWYKPYVMDNTVSNGYDDYTYKKIDILSSSPLFAEDMVVNYFKAICDRKRKNKEGKKGKEVKATD